MTEFIYRYNAPDRAQVFLSFQLETPSRAKEVASVLGELERGGMTGHDISDDEMAKSHARYLIGGASDVPNERIFRFGAIYPLLRRYRLPIDRFYCMLTFCAPTCTCPTHTPPCHAPCTRPHAHATRKNRVP